MHIPLRLPPLLLLSVLAMSGAATAAPASHINDFPTVDRVLYVQECMRAHPGPQFEMINKCSCSLDALATTVKYNDYVSVNTIIKAMSIGGERGGAVRDVPSYEPQVKHYKELLGKAEKGCFINSDPK